MLLFCCLLCFPVRKAFEFLFNDFHDLIWNYLQKITLRAIFSNLPVWSYSITTVSLVFSPVFLSCICPIFLVFRQNLIYSCLFTLWSQTDFFTTEFSQHYNGRVCAPHSCLLFPGDAEPQQPRASAILTLQWPTLTDYSPVDLHHCFVPVSFLWACSNITVCTLYGLLLNWCIWSLSSLEYLK